VYAIEGSQPSGNPNLSTLECDLPKHDRPAACVIAQQYSSVTLFSLRFHSRKVQLIKRCESIINTLVLLFLK
jgi:hypothetical protein